MFGDRIKIMWEQQLVSSVSLCLWFWVFVHKRSSICFLSLNLEKAINLFCAMAYFVDLYILHAMNSELIVSYLNGKKFGNGMAFGYQIFYHGCYSNGPDHLINDHLNTQQLKVHYSNVCYSNPQCIGISSRSK